MSTEVGCVRECFGCLCVLCLGFTGPSMAHMGRPLRKLTSPYPRTYGIHAEVAYWAKAALQLHACVNLAYAGCSVVAAAMGHGCPAASSGSVWLSSEVLWSCGGLQLLLTHPACESALPGDLGVPSAVLCSLLCTPVVWTVWTRIHAQCWCRTVQRQALLVQCITRACECDETSAWRLRRACARVFVRCRVMRADPRMVVLSPDRERS